MSARRFGFEAFFEPLYAVERIRTSLLEGTGASIGFFTREILPLVTALRASDRFATAAIVRKTSPLLERSVFEAAREKQAEILSAAKAVCDGLLDLVSRPRIPTGREILRYVAEKGLFEIPDALSPFIVGDEANPIADVDVSDDGGIEEPEIGTELGAWRQALEAPFDQIEKYDRYVRGVSQFDTHQGVKGLEFPRVMVIVNDDEARGFMFAYDKLFKMKEKSKTDIENESTGKDNTIGRTRRLFYVTCSRAEESLAVVYYTDSTERAYEGMIKQQWFAADEIEILR